MNAAPVQTVAVVNTPPQIIVSTRPAVLIPVSGPPVIHPVAGTGFSRVINTRAILLQPSTGGAFYLHVDDGWMTTPSVEGPWQLANSMPAGIDAVANQLTVSAQGDPLSGGGVTPPPSLSNGVPTIYVVHRPSELIVFKAEPVYQAIAGTGGLQWATNTTSYVIRNTADGSIYVLIAGRWYNAPSLQGPWAFVPASALPSDFASISPGSPAGVVYEGYTPGYMGTVVAPDGVVVYDTGYDYQPWVGTTYYAPPATYGVDADPVYNPATDWTYGFAMGLTTAAMVDAWNSPVCYSTTNNGYPCCGSSSANVYDQYGDVHTSGTESYYANHGNEGRNYSGNYTNYRTGTTGSVSAYQNYDEKTGTETYGTDTTASTPRDATGTVQRYGNYTPDDPGSATYATMNRSEIGAFGTTNEAQRTSGYDPSTNTYSSGYSATTTGPGGSDQRTSSYNATTDTTTNSVGGSVTGPGGDSRSTQASGSYDAATGARNYDASRSASTAGGSSVTTQSNLSTGSGGPSYGHETTVTNAQTGQSKTFGSGYSDGSAYAGADGQVYRSSGGGFGSHYGGGGFGDRFGGGRFGGRR